MFVREPASIRAPRSAVAEPVDGLGDALPCATPRSTACPTGRTRPSRSTRPRPLPRHGSSPSEDSGVWGAAVRLSASIVNALSAEYDAKRFDATGIADSPNKSPGRPTDTRVCAWELDSARNWKAQAMSSTNAAAPWSWPELHEAQRAVLLDVLIQMASRSRADLTRRSGLSRATLSRIGRDLVELGLDRRARPPLRPDAAAPLEILRVRSEAAHFVGFKLTGNALYSVLSDLHANVLETVEFPLPFPASMTLFSSSRQRSTASDKTTSGSCPSASASRKMSRRSTVAAPRRSNFLGWNNVPLVELVSKATGLPTSVANDVQALTVAHHWFGAGRGCKSMVLIGFGAGIGMESSRTTSWSEDPADTPARSATHWWA